MWSNLRSRQAGRPRCRWSRAVPSPLSIPRLATSPPIEKFVGLSSKLSTNSLHRPPCVLREAPRLRRIAPQHKGISLMALRKMPHPEVPRKARPRRTHGILPAYGNCPASSYLPPHARAGGYPPFQLPSCPLVGPGLRGAKNHRVVQNFAPAPPP